MQNRFTYNTGKYNHLITQILAFVSMQIVALIPLIICFTIMGYSNERTLSNTIIDACIVVLIAYSPIVIYNYLIDYKSFIYDMYFDETNLSIVYYDFFIKKNILIPYNELSFAVKTINCTCLVLYKNHKKVTFMRSRSPEWDEYKMIEIIKILLDITNNKLEKPLTKILFSKKEYFYTDELKESGVAKQLIDISNKMNK